MIDPKGNGPAAANDRPAETQTKTNAQIIYRPDTDWKRENERHLDQMERARRYQPAIDKIANHVMDRKRQKVASVWRFRNRLDRMPHSIVPCAMPPSVIPGRTKPFAGFFYVVLTRSGSAIGYPDSMIVPLDKLHHVQLPDWGVNADFLKSGKYFFTDDDIEELQATGGCSARRNYLARIILTLEVLWQSRPPSSMRAAISRMRTDRGAA